MEAIDKKAVGWYLKIFAPVVKHINFCLQQKLSFPFRPVHNTLHIQIDCLDQNHQQVKSLSINFNLSID